MGKTVDKLFAGVQSLYNGILSGIGKFLEVAQISAEIAAAFVTGGGSILVQIGVWLTSTLPKLLRQANSVMTVVNTLRNFKVQNVKQFLNPSGMGGFLVKGLFGILQKTVGKVAGAINKALPVINISDKSWFNPFKYGLCGAVQALEVVKNPAEALNEGTGKLKNAISGLLVNFKIGKESHKLWVEKSGSGHVVMMASNQRTLAVIIRGFETRIEKLKEDESGNRVSKIEDPGIDIGALIIQLKGLHTKIGATPLDKLTSSDLDTVVPVIKAIEQYLEKREDAAKGTGKIENSGVKVSESVPTVKSGTRLESYE